MERKKKTELAKNGWRVGSADEFLELSAEESALIELELALSDDLRVRRVAKGSREG